MNKITAPFMGLFLLIIAGNIFAQVPRSFSYQGMLLNAAKQPVTGIHRLTVTLYDAPLEGNTLHSENFSSEVRTGIFTVMLGSETPFEPSVTFDKQYWLGISIDGGAELSPRTALTSVPYAIHADAASALSKDAKGAVTSLNGKSGNLIIKGGQGTDIRTEGNIITITANVTNIDHGITPQGSTNIIGTANQVLANGTSGSQQSGNVTLTTPQNIHTAATPTFSGMTLSGLNTTGVVHNNASGLLSTSLIVDADVSGSAAIADTKLATISTSGKVANTATTATSSNTANTIVLRDGSGTDWHMLQRS